MIANRSWWWLLALPACAGESESAVSSAPVCSGPAVHGVRYDAHGRTAAVTRSDLGSVQYAYDPVTGRMAGRTYVDADGNAARTIAYQRDGAGRPVVTTHSAGSETAAYSATYQRDRLMSVSGPGFVKTFAHRDDGKLTSAALELTGWRTITAATGYHTDGSPRSSSIEVRDASGALLLSTEKQFDYDAWGRLSRLTVNGDEIYRLEYDAEGRMGRAVIEDVGEIAISHDSATHVARGYRHRESTFDLEVNAAFGPRGLVESESYAFTGTGTDAESLTRNFAYDARGFLTSVAGGESFDYGHDAQGLMSSASDQHGARAIERSGRSMTAGGVGVDLDAQGRITRRGDVSFEYGATGDIRRVTEDERSFTFAYDETGHRLMKLEAGVPVTAYVADGVLTANMFSEPIRIAGRLIGLLENGVFRPLPLDPRGSSVRSGGDALAPASPYGARIDRGAEAAVIDFVGMGYDADLGTVRMGVRDYDPFLGQFLSADPLFLEEPSKCVGSPVDCNLYAYARNDPLSLIDPDGREPKGVVGWINFVYQTARAHAEGRTFSETQIQSFKTYHTNNAARKPQDSCIAAVKVGMQKLYSDPLLHFDTDTIEKGMRDMRAKRLVSAPTEIAFQTNGGLVARNGSRSPDVLEKSVFDTVVTMAKGDPGYSVFALSLLDGYHSVTLTLDNRNPDQPKLYWSDQWKAKGGFKEYDRAAVDAEVTRFVKDTWTGQAQGKKHDTVVRVWRVFSGPQK